MRDFWPRNTFNMISLCKLYFFQFKGETITVVRRPGMEASCHVCQPMLF
jgi:hypothetical protein